MSAESFAAEILSLASGRSPLSQYATNVKAPHARLNTITAWASAGRCFGAKVHSEQSNSASSERNSHEQPPVTDRISAGWPPSFDFPTLNLVSAHRRSGEIRVFESTATEATICKHIPLATLGQCLPRLARVA